MGKEAKQTNMWKQKRINKIKIRVSGQWPAHTITSLSAYNQACIRRQDYAYASSCPEIQQKKKKKVLA